VLAGHLGLKDQPANCVVWRPADQMPHGLLAEAVPRADKLACMDEVVCGGGGSA
jgi:hypothetical protein